MKHTYTTTRQRMEAAANERRAMTNLRRAERNADLAALAVVTFLIGIGAVALMLAG